MIAEEDITILYQGDLKEGFVGNIIRTKKVFPKSKFILSTFPDVSIDKVRKYFDEVIVSKPHPVKLLRGTKSLTSLDNTNNQIISTREGLRKSTTKYTFKLRTDFAVLNQEFLHFWDKFPRYYEGYKIFENRLIVPEAFTRNPNKHLVYHPSDLILFGLTSDLLDYFDVPYVQARPGIEKTIAGVNGFAPEQHIFISYLNKKGRNTGDYTLSSLIPTEFNIEETDKYFVSNFIVLNWQQFGTTIPLKFDTEKCRLRTLKTCYSNRSWTKKYEELIKNA